VKRRSASEGVGSPKPNPELKVGNNRWTLRLGLTGLPIPKARPNIDHLPGKEITMKVKFYSLAYSLLVATQWVTTGNAQIPSDNLAGSEAVYAMTNDAVDNRILVYSRNSNGLLTFQRSVSTHGRGSGGIIDPLESQGSVVLSQGGSFLYAANAGSGTITTFRVVPPGLAFIGEAASGGAEPISITIHGDLLYVLNTVSITGFQIERNGKLTAIPSSTRFLEQVGGRDLGASDIAFSPDGKFLALTERLANQIVVFPIEADGAAGTPIANNSNGKHTVFLRVYAKWFPRRV
jgi:hypothetical protein